MNELNKILSEYILASPKFSSAVFSGINRGVLENAWNKVAIKPVMIKKILSYQINYYDALKCITKNYARDSIERELNVIAAAGFKSIYLRYEDSGIQIQVTKKGKILVKQHHGLEEKKPDLSHDNKKKRLIKEEPENAYLAVLGLSDAKGQIKPSMQGKFRQINEFVNIIAAMENWPGRQKPVHIIDCGSGNAYLTFAAYHYFKHVLGKDISIKGVDINAELIERNTAKARALGWDSIGFDFSNILGFIPEQVPTVTLALHACDTATDECLMKAMHWQSEFILSVPCCHHNLQERLKDAATGQSFKAVMKHGLLRERLGDILTDAFRAAILEIMGYKTDVIQFVTAEHTARNLMIRAKKISDRPLKDSVRNYLALKHIWKVTPALEEMMGAISDFSQRIQKEE